MSKIKWWNGTLSVCGVSCHTIGYRAMLVWKTGSIEEDLELVYYQ